MPDQLESDEIDLFDLIESLWKERVFIFGITSLITLIGLIYSILIPTIYEAKVEILPPSNTNIAELNKLEDVNSTNFKSESFSDFLKILETNEVRKTFLSQEGVKETLFPSGASLQNALKALEKMIVLEKSKKVPLTRFGLKFQFKDSIMAANYANQLVQLAVDQYRTRLTQTFSSSKNQEIIKLKNQMQTLIDTHDNRLNKEIKKLKEAFKIASKLNIHEPIERELYMPNSSITNEMRYLYSRGTHALSAEIESILERKKNIDFIDGLSSIEERLSYLDILTFDAEKVMPVTIDLTAAAPDQRIKPIRSRIVAVSAFIGGVLAVMLVFFRNAVRKRKERIA